MKRTGVIVWVLAGLVLIAGCSSAQEIDQEAWGQQLASFGVTVKDWPKYRSAVQQVCEMDDPSAYLAAAKDSGTTLEQVKVNYRFACPDRLPVLDAAARKLQDASSSVDAACSTPKDARTHEQELLAEAMSC